VIGLITCCLVNVVAVMGDVFCLVYNFHKPLSLKVGCPSSGAGCDGRTTETCSSISSRSSKIYDSDVA
jgi:hypothetical protein